MHPTLNQLKSPQKNPFAEIDAHAKNCPSSKAIDVETLANYLQEKASTPLERARAIYVWLAYNISYDDDSYNSGAYSSHYSTDVLETRTAVCAGYSQLFLALGKEMNLDIEEVSGYAKGYGYSVGEKFDKPNHAWNVITIYGEGRIFDATWGFEYYCSGNFNSKIKKPSGNRALFI